MAIMWFWIKYVTKRGGFGPTNYLNSVTLNWSACTNSGKWVVVYLRGRSIAFASFYDLSIGFWNCSDRICICCFHFIFTFMLAGLLYYVIEIFCSIQSILAKNASIICINMSQCIFIFDMRRSSGNGNTVSLNWHFTHITDYIHVAFTSTIP